MIDDSPLQVLRSLRDADPELAAEVMGEALLTAIPEELELLHLCVYRLMLSLPELYATDALEILFRIGVRLEKEK